ncbi:MAG: hypothetical protein J7502_13220 [Flavisolibacter sp.]|nr:hypothetical protein [Flavisolibacter sp.]
MALNVLNDFSFLTFLAGGLFMITGIIYKFKPPKKMTWFGAMQLKAARSSEEAWREAIRFAVKPIIVAGLFLTVVGLLPIFFSNFQFFTFLPATTLILATSLLLISSINKHINSLFDEAGNRRDNA